MKCLGCGGNGVGSACSDLGVGRHLRYSKMLSEQEVGEEEVGEQDTTTIWVWIVLPLSISNIGCASRVFGSLLVR